MNHWPEATQYQSGYQPNEVICANALVRYLTYVFWARRCKSITPQPDLLNRESFARDRPILATICIAAPLSTHSIIGATNSAAYGGLVFALSYPRYFRHKAATKSEQDQTWLRRTPTPFGLSRKTYCQGCEVRISLHLYENLSRTKARVSISAAASAVSAIRSWLVLISVMNSERNFNCIGDYSNECNRN